MSLSFIGGIVAGIAISGAIVYVINARYDDSLISSPCVNEELVVRRLINEILHDIDNKGRGQAKVSYSFTKDGGVDENIYNTLCNELEVHGITVTGCDCSCGMKDIILYKMN